MELEPEVIHEETANNQQPVEELPAESPPAPDAADAELEADEIDEANGDEPAAGDFAEDDGEDEDQEEEPEEAGKKRKVFISYNHNPNDTVVATRIFEELSQEHDVFLDQNTILGVDYQEKTERFLREADYVIALISPGSIASHWVTAELEDAFERARKEGRPTVIPIRINYEGPYSLILRTCIGRFQAYYWNNQNYAELFARLHAAIARKILPLAKPILSGTDIIPIGDDIRDRYKTAYVEPRELNAKSVSFAENSLLWVTGDAVIRNYVALSLAATTESKSVYEITKLRKWSEINDTYLTDSTIVLRDALPAPYLNESGAVAEWHSLRAIIERNNIIIATAPDDEFERLTDELRRYHFTDYARLPVNHNSYTEESKYEIFNRLLDHLFFTTGEVDDDKYAWASDLARKQDELTTVGPGGSRALERRARESRAKFRENIKQWSPADIERFVLSLSQVRSQGDIARLLQRTGAIEDEIRAWFLGLDDSTRCFILTVAIFNDLSNEALWERYKIIVEQLRQFDQSLRLLPLGICRKRAQPYVSADGPIYLIDERIAEATRQEVARSYREYFVELTPRLMEWSTPLGRKPKTIEQRNQRKLKIEETRDARLAIARMVGMVGRLGLDDLSGILDFWATDSNIHIRKSVAVALEQTVKSPSGVNPALNLLEKWCHDLGSNGERRWRALAAAIALGNVTVAANDPYVTGRALQYLRSFARSRRPDARFYASIAVRSVARHARRAAIEGILGRLAKDDRTEVRLNVAAALNETITPEADVAKLSELWLNSPDKNRRWIALCGIVTSRAMQNGASNKYQQLLTLLEQKETADILASVLSEVVADAHYGQVASDTFLHLSQASTGQAWINFAAALGEAPLSKLDKEFLPRLRFAAPPFFNERAIDVRHEALKHRLADPPRLLSTLKSWLKQETVRLEVFRALALLVDDSPTSYRMQFIEALAIRFAQDPAGVNDMLAVLEGLAPAYFEFLAEAVLHHGFKRSLDNPAGFVLLAYQQLTNGATAGRAREALESLVSEDSRSELLAALLAAYVEAPKSVDSLLSTLRAIGSAELIGVVHEFNYRLIEEAIATPELLPGLILDLIRKNTDTLSLLNYLATSEPQGARSRLVHALVAAKLNNIADADELLGNPELKLWPNLASLSAEISRSFYVRRIFSPVTNFIWKRTEEAF